MPCESRVCRALLLLVTCDEQLALPLHIVAVLLVVLAVMVMAIWPARSDRQRRLREALMRGLAGDDWP